MSCWNELVRWHGGAGGRTHDSKPCARWSRCVDHWRQPAIWKTLEVDRSTVEQVIDAFPRMLSPSPIRVANARRFRIRQGGADAVLAGEAPRPRDPRASRHGERGLASCAARIVY